MNLTCSTELLFYFICEVLFRYLLLMLSLLQQIVLLLFKVHNLNLLRLLCKLVETGLMKVTDLGMLLSEGYPLFWFLKQIRDMKICKVPEKWWSNRQVKIIFKMNYCTGDGDISVKKTGFILMYSYSFLLNAAEIVETMKWVITQKYYNELVYWMYGNTTVYINASLTCAHTRRSI